jgi:hypothetical protein
MSVAAVFDAHPASIVERFPGMESHPFSMLTLSQFTTHIDNSTPRRHAAGAWSTSRLH